MKPKSQFLRASILPTHIVLSLGLTFALSMQSAHADATWVGGTSQDWNTGSNWSANPPGSQNYFINTATAGVYPTISSAPIYTPVDLIIGDGANTGRLDQSTGTLALANTSTNGNWMQVARNSGTGTYNLTGDGSLEVGKLWVGGFVYGENGTGTVTIDTTGSVSANSTDDFSGWGQYQTSICVGWGSYPSGSGNGTLNLVNGTINSPNRAIYVGAWGSTGVLNQSGGTINANGLNVGRWFNQNATVNVTGGTLNASFLNIGQTGNGGDTIHGTLSVSGSGTVNSEGDMVVAMGGSATSTGEVDINTGGVLNVASTTKRWMVVNQYDTIAGTVAVNGGTLNLNANTDLRFSSSGGTGTSIVNLNSGAITGGSGGVIAFNSANATGVNNTVNLNGGTLTIGQIITGGSNGTRVFNFNGGTLKAAGSSTSFFASGVASTANVRNSGAFINTNGYDVTIAQDLLHSNVGGDSATDGGLAKSGAGTLTIAGVNTYTGATSVNAGTLAVSAGSINTSTGVTINGSSAKYLYNSSTVGTNAITLTQGTLDGTGTVGAVTVGAGTGGIVTNGNSSTSKLTMGSLTFSGGGTLNLNLAGGATTTEGMTVTNALTTSGTAGSVVVNISPVSPLDVGTVYNLIGYGSFSGNITDFIYSGNTARKTGTFAATGGFITLTVNGDSPKWTGLDNGNWLVGSTGAGGNWKLVSAGTATDYLSLDDVLFDDTAAGTKTVDISAANVTPNSTTFNNSTGNDYTVSSTGGYGIAGTGPLIKSGSGTLTITAVNTFTGATTINAGTLQIGDGTTDGSIAGSSSITNNSALAYNLATSRTYANVIGGAGTLAKSGAGTLTLSGTNTYAGATSVNAGVLNIQNAAALGSTAAGTTVASGATLQIQGGITTTAEALTVSGPGAGGQSGALVNASGTNSYGGLVTLAADTTFASDADTLNLTSSGTLTGSGYNLTLAGAANGSITSAIGTGAGSVIKNGAGFWSLSTTNTNTYSGGTTVNNGTLAIGGTATANSNGLGTGNVTVNTGGVLRTGYAVSSNTNSVTLANNMTLAGGSVFADDAYQHLSGTLNVTAAGTLGSTYNGGGGDTNKGLSLDGVVSGSANLTIQQSGIDTGHTWDASIVYFTNAANTYSGTITVTPMTTGTGSCGGSYLGLNASNALQYATVNLNGNNVSVNRFGTSPLVFNTGLGTATLAALTGSGDVALTGYNESTHAYGTDAIALTVGGNNSDATYSGVMSGGGSLTKTGSGTLTLGGYNSYTGGTVVNSGTLALGVGGASGAVRGTLTINSGAAAKLNATDALGYGTGTSVTQININGGTLDNAVNANNSYLASWTLTGGTMTSTGGGTYQIIGGSNTIASIASATTSAINANVAIRGASSILSIDVADGAATDDLLISGTMSDSPFEAGSNGIAKTGAGTLLLTGTNTYTGPTSVSNGTLQIGDGTTDGSIATSSGITDNSALAYNLTGSQSYSNAITGTGSLTKSGVGTLTLSGTGTYAGATTVNGGTLTVGGSGSINGSSGITINGSGAKLVQAGSAASTPAVTLTQGTLDGSGTMGAVTVANGANVLANGNGGVGNGTTTTLTVGSLAFGGAATANLQVVSGSPSVVVTGALATTPASGNVTINATGTWANGLNNLIGYGSFGGNITDFTLGTITGLTSRQALGTLQTNGNNIALNITGDAPKWTGLDGNNWVVGTTGASKNWKLVSGGTATDYIEGDAVLFDDSVGAGPTTIDISAANVSPTSTAFNNSTKDYVLTSSGGYGIAAGTLVKNGTGTVTVTTTNTYTGATTINAGTLQIGDGTTDGSIAASSGIADNGRLVYKLTTDQSYSNNIGGTGSVTMGGNGAILTLGGTNSFTGGLNIVDSGTVNAGGNDALGGPANILNFGALSNGILNVNGKSVTLGGLTGDATAVIQNYNFASNGTLTVNSTTDSSFGGAIQNGTYGELALTKTGSATLTLSGDSTHTGATTVNGGTLAVSGTYSGSSAITVNGTGTLAVSGTCTDSSTITVSGTGTLNATGTLTSTARMLVGNQTGSGTLNVSNGTTTLSGLAVSNSTAPTDSAVGTVNVTGGTLTSPEDVVVGLGGTQTGTMTIGGGTVNAGTTVKKWLIIGQFDTVSGTLAINSGSLNLNTNTDIRFSSYNGTGTNAINQNGGDVTFYGDNATTVGGSGVVDMQRAGAAATNNTYNLNGGTLTTNQVTSFVTTGTRTFNFNGGTLKPASNVDAATFFNLGSGTGTAVANVRNGGARIDTNGIDITIAQALAHSNVGGDNATDGGLAKVGTGTLSLTGTNTYTGATAVNSGTLALGATGSIATSSGVTIAAGATLDTTAATPFAMSATQTITFKVDGSGAGSSGLLKAAALNITNAHVAFTVVNPLDDNAYVLASYTSLTGSAFASVTPPTGYTINYTYNSGTQIALVKAAGYDSWATNKGLTGANNGPLQDPNNNGITNLMEYALNGDPLNGESPASILPTEDSSGPNLVFDFHRLHDSASDTTQVFQYGSDLTGWTDVAIPASGTVGIVVVTADSATIDHVTVTVPKGSNTKLFGRLHVSKP